MRILVLVAGALGVGAGAPSGIRQGGPARNPRVPAATPGKVPVDEKEIARFLRSFWQVPVPAQGEPPPRFSPLEASLDSEQCGVCHRPQYDDWKTTLHARNMGPGVLGQTVDLIGTDPETALRCYGCHAPLSEQGEQVRVAGALEANGRFDPKLQAQGLTCAGCHVRHHQRFGPPRRDGSLPTDAPRAAFPHNGVTRTPAFERAEFCKGCHQFGRGGLALNGKLLENTYNEWRESPYGRRGVACQTCHMPDRRHLWRGIHDPHMVKVGVLVQLDIPKERYQPGERLEALLAITNRGVGHYFPTYVTPKVVVRAELVDGQGVTVPGSLQEEFIGREVTLDLSREVYDTRIPPGGTHRFRYVRPMPRKGLRLRIGVVVMPDHFYERFFQSVLPGAAKGRPLIQQALEDARRSAFSIFSRELPVS